MPNTTSRTKLGTQTSKRYRPKPRRDDSSALGTSTFDDASRHFSHDFRTTVSRFHGTHGGKSFDKLIDDYLEDKTGHANIAGTECVHIDSASLQALYKWQGVIQLEKALSFQNGNRGFYVNNDMDAVYLVEEHSKVEGNVGGTRVEVTGAQARGQLLSMLLRRIGCLRTLALREKAKADTMRGSAEFAMSVDRRVEQIEQSFNQSRARLRRDAAMNTILKDWR